MDTAIRVLLYDVLNSIVEIESFIEKDLTFEHFQADVKTKRAVERNLEIIGEAVNRIIKIDPGFQITSSKKIISLRNRIIHGYDSISDELIWSVLIQHLPVLEEEVRTFLNE